MPQIQVFPCPSCGATLSYDGGPEVTFACQFCGTTVVVPEELHSGAALQGQLEPGPQASAMVTPDLAGQPPIASNIPADMPGAAATSGDVADMGASMAEVARLASAGQTLEAVKLMRQLDPRMQLKDALEAVKAMGGAAPTGAASGSVRRVSKAGGAGCSLGCVALTVGIAGFILAMMYLPIRLSGSYDQAVAAARSSAEVNRALGYPVEVEWWWPTMGEISCSLNSCSANYNIPIHGSENKGTIWVISDSHGAGFFNEGVWTLRAEVMVNNGATIDLAAPPVAEAAPTLSAQEADATQGAVARSTRVAEATEEAEAAGTQMAREAETTAEAEAEAATATAQVEARATARAVIAAQAGWPVVLRDTFADNRLGWPTDLGEGALSITTTVAAQSYAWEAVVGDLGYSWGFPLKPQPFRDFAASVKVKVLEGDENGWNFFGLVFRHAAEEAGFFGINRNGEWWVKLRYPYSLADTLAGFGDDSAAIHSGLGQINQITVRALGDDLIFAVNDQVMTQLNLSLPAGDVGLGAEWDGTSRRPVKVEFSDFAVSAPE